MQPGLDMGFGQMQQGAPNRPKLQPTDRFKRFMPPGGQPNFQSQVQPLPNFRPGGALEIGDGVYHPEPGGPRLSTMPGKPMVGNKPIVKPQPIQRGIAQPGDPRVKQLMERMGQLRPQQAPNPGPQRGVGLEMGDGMGQYQPPTPAPQAQAPGIPQAAMQQGIQALAANPGMQKFFQMALSEGFTPAQINNFLANQQGGKVGFQQ